MSESENKAEALRMFMERFDDVFAFRRTLTPETDRGCALMAAAYLDAELETLLRKYFVANRNVQDDIFGHSGP